MMNKITMEIITINPVIKLYIWLCSKFNNPNAIPLFQTRYMLKKDVIKIST